jgi:hypothetical protein
MKSGYFAKTFPFRLQGFNQTEAILSGVANRARVRGTADVRQITARAVRFVWETMLGGQPAVPRDLPDRLPPDLIRFAAAKGCLGSVMNALDRWGLASRLEEDERRKARFALARTALATAAMRRDLGPIISECGNRNIDIVLFKGHDLITTCYHDDTIRPVTDIDLLVKRRDHPGLAKVLSDAGYRQSPGVNAGTWFRGALIIDVHGEFVGDARNPAAAYLPRIPTDEIFDGSRQREIDGVAYRSPNPHHSLIMTALHALTHSYLMDFWFMDAGVLLIKNNRGAFSDTLIDTARRYKLIHVLNYHLWAIKEIFGYPGVMPLPEDYRPPLPIRRFIKAAVRRTDYLFFGDVLLGLTIDTYRRKLYYFREMAIPRRDIIASEMGIDPHNILGVYRARLAHLARAGFRILFSGRRW